MMYFLQDKWKRWSKWQRFRVVVISVAVLLSTVRIISVDRSCKALDPDKIKYASAEYYAKRLSSGGVSVLKEGGGSANYPLVPYSSAEDYLESYPDCCRYYPWKIDGQSLSIWERYLDGMCGFIGITAHTRYLKDGKIEKLSNPSARVRIINRNYEILDDPKER